MRTLRPLAVLLFLLLLFTVSWQASAAGAWATKQNPPNVESLPTALVSWAWEALARIWAKNGCVIDPNGWCAPPSAPMIHGKNGCGVDPNGRCAPAAAPAVQGKNGCDIDPDGRCHS